MTIVQTLAVLAAVSFANTSPVETGTWRAWLDGPGGELPFELELTVKDGDWNATVVNATERITYDRLEVTDGTFKLHLDPYDSRITARISDDGRRLTGEWELFRGEGRWTRMPFHATHGVARRFGLPLRNGLARTIAGRYAVQFEKDEHGAVGAFECKDGMTVSGTFLTTLGDYRFLAGEYNGDELRLSCFDGAHAFLFTAKWTEDGELAGDFYSRDSWHERWTGRLDATAKLPDPWKLTQWTDAVPLSDVAFPDLSGRERRLDDPEFAGKARIMVIFGSWCPNCYDATTCLAELEKRYRSRGLAVLGLAFEFGDEHERNADFVRRYLKGKGAEYPVLIAGPSNKKKASEAFPLLDRVRAYPTTVFMDGTGKVRAVYTGFSGPATGAEHERLRERFEGLIEEMLADSAD